jgi:RNA polymerase sigma-70 factor, ECF subfamily
MHSETQRRGGGSRSWSTLSGHRSPGPSLARPLGLAGRLTLLLQRAAGLDRAQELRRANGAASLAPAHSERQRVPDPAQRARPARAEVAPGTESDDADLVRAALAGDREAIDVLAKRMRCIPRILSALNFQSGRGLDEHSLADVAQDCALVVWRKLASFRPSHSLEGWVYGIVLRELLNARRRHGSLLRRAGTQPDVANIVQPDPVSDASDYEEGELEAALDELSDAEALVIRLRHYEDLSFPAIGARLSIPENTAKTRYHRGLERLREIVHVRTRQREHRS